MSKIIVDEMPNEPSDCPFAHMVKYHPDTEFYNSHCDYACSINPSMCLCTDPNAYCEYLTELPKGGE